MTDITRRSALISGVAAVGTANSACSTESPPQDAVFQHGVASGDPSADGFIIWSRVTTTQNTEFRVKWQVSKDKDFGKIIKKGTLKTGPNRDFTLKTEIDGLKSGQSYFYRFKTGNLTSPIGHARTLPSGSVNSARFAVVSCTNYPFGYFNVYDHIAKQEFDAVIHLGDYFYEYGEDGYGAESGRELERAHNPRHETISLADYRTRHAQYKAEVESQAMHAAHTMIAIWDDHETANNSWRDGAQNHNSDEGVWADRRAAAMQAYYEWMPVREPKPGRPRKALFRTFDYGNLLSLSTLETRLTARVRQLDYNQYADSFVDSESVTSFVRDVVWDPSRELLGTQQREYILNALHMSQKSGQKWRLLANQVIMARVAMPDISDWAAEPFIDTIEKELPSIRKLVAMSPLGLPLNLDSWDGYPAARERFYEDCTKGGVNDLLVLTGDTHDWWANTLQRLGGTPMGAEFGVSSVTSPGFGAYLAHAGAEFSNRIIQKNPEVDYLGFNAHGYIDLSLHQEQGKVSFMSVDTVKSRDYHVETMKTFDLKPATPGLSLQTNTQ